MYIEVDHDDPYQRGCFTEPIPGALVNPIHFSPTTLIHALVSDPEFAGG